MYACMPDYGWVEVICKCLNSSILYIVPNSLIPKPVYLYARMNSCLNGRKHAQECLNASILCT